MPPPFPDDDYTELSDPELEAGFDQAEEKKNEFEPVPDGSYQVNTEKAELKRSKDAGNLMLTTTLKILGPTHAGRLLFRRNMLQTAENLSWLKTDLAKYGIRLGKLSELPDRLRDLLDVRLNVKVVTKGEFQNVYLQSAIDGTSVPSDRCDDAPF
jgi:hypothetical protein